MTQNSDDADRTHIRVRVSNDHLESIRQRVAAGEYRSRPDLIDSALSMLFEQRPLSLTSGSSEELDALSHNQSISLFISLILVSRVMTEGERDHICSIAEAGAESGFPLAKTFIEMMQLDRPLEARAAE